MPCCSAYGCSNRSDNQPVVDKTDSSHKRTYHKFPSDPGRQRQWLVNVRRHDFVPTRYSTLCSDHFEEWCFDRTGNIVRLRRTAVPTLFAFSAKYRNQRKRTISDGENNPVEPSFKKSLTENVKSPFKNENSEEENGKSPVKNESNGEEDIVYSDEENMTLEKSRERYFVPVKQEQERFYDEENDMNEEMDQSFESPNAEESIEAGDVSQGNEKYSSTPERTARNEINNSSQTKVKIEKDPDRTVAVNAAPKETAKDKIIYLPDNRTYFEFATPKRKVVLQLKPPKSEPSELKTNNLEELIDSLKTRQVITSEVQDLLESFGELPQGLERLPLQGPKSTTKLPEDVKKFASVLYTFAPKAFNLLRKEFNFPDRQVLQDRLKVKNYWPGFTKESLIILKNGIQKASANRICSIMMDSVDLKKQHSYNYKNDRWIGHLEFGGGLEPCDSDEIPLATEVLIFTAVGIGSPWKLPFGYFLNKGMAGEELHNLLLEAISCLQDCGLNVRAVVCEGSVSTVKMGTLLGCKIHTKLLNEMTTGFPNPSNPQQKIHLVFGFQHVFTLLRHLLEDKGVLRSSIYGVIRWKFFKQLLAHKRKNKPGPIKSLSANHREFSHLQSIIRMCKPGFCYAVSRALHLAREKGIRDYANSRAAANFCADLYRAFDMLNSRSHACKEKPPVDSVFMAEQLESMSIIGQRIFDLELLSGSPVTRGGRWMSATLLPFTLKSVGCLASELLIERTVPHLSTYRLNLYHSTQIINCIEKRGGWDGVPTASQFQIGYKKLLTQCFSIWSEGEAYTNDFEGEDLTIGQGFSCPLRIGPNFSGIEDLVFHHSTLTEYDATTSIAVKFIRHIAQRLTCTDCVSLMVNDLADTNRAQVDSAQSQPLFLFKEILNISENFLDTYLLASDNFDEERLVLLIYQRYMMHSTKFHKLNNPHIKEEPHHVISLIKVFIRIFIRYRLYEFKNRCQMKLNLLQHS
ncbi:uncharacterized protein [Palaemon carinicauda]|uniref:uncharacterized protein n=1 Tax=Palaemon carinicauda TaxID=392227 RepID=UPI0035B60F37